MVELADHQRLTVLERAPLGDVALCRDPIGDASVRVADRGDQPFDPVGRAVLSVIQRLALESFASLQRSAGPVQRSTVRAFPL